MEWFTTGIILIGIVVVLLGGRSAYYNGCCDGYGACKEPNNPGYQKARLYLKKYMSHRWNIE